MPKTINYILLTDNSTSDSFYNSIKESEEMMSHIEFGDVEILSESDFLDLMNNMEEGELQAKLEGLEEDLKNKREIFNKAEQENAQFTADFEAAGCDLADLSDQNCQDIQNLRLQTATTAIETAIAIVKIQGEINQVNDRLDFLSSEVAAATNMAGIYKRQTVKFKQNEFSNKAWTQFTTDFLQVWGDHSTKGTSIRRDDVTRNLPEVKRVFSLSENANSYTNEVIEEFNLNYLNTKYENSIFPTQISELSLPNFYKELDTPSGTLDPFFFDNYDPAAATNIEQYRNVILSYENYENLKKLNGKDAEFPMASVTSPSNGTFDIQESIISSAIVESYTDSLLVNMSLALSQLSDQALGDRRLSVWSEREFSFTETSTADSDVEIITSSGSLPYIDLLELFKTSKDVANALKVNGNDNDKIYLGDNSEKSIKLAKYEVTSLDYLLSSIEVLSRVQGIMTNKLLSFEDMVKNQKNYSEILFYQIDKYLQDSTTGDPIQTFWVPNASGINPIEYIDTQVKYNTKYVYDVIAHTAVVGVKYYYTPGDSFIDYNFIGPDIINTIATDVISYPTLSLVPIKYFQYEGTILDSPPLMPHIDIIPYINEDRKLLFQMHAKIGEYSNVPVILDTEDQVYIDDLKEAAGYMDGAPIIFRTDDEISSFYIYRLDEIPTSYDSFSDSVYAVVSTEVTDEEDSKLSWSASFIDGVVPNRPYYYMFRTVDQHNHKSYPSEVYKVTMVNDAGAIFPIIDTIQFNAEDPGSVVKTKNFQKLMQIIPTYNQRALDYENSNLIDPITDLVVSSPVPLKDQIQLGTETDKVWNKTFKIRLTSKHTGKKIDLNVTFNVENE